MTKGVNFEVMFSAALRWQDAVGAVAGVYFENRRMTTFSGFAAEDKAWTLVGRMREDVWDRARTAWARLTNRSPQGFPYSVDFVALTYHTLAAKADPAALKKWLKTAFPDQPTEETE
jgi:hypothetical protein